MKRIGILNFLPKGINPVKNFYKMATCDSFIFVDSDLDRALDFIAICKR